MNKKIFRLKISNFFLLIIFFTITLIPAFYLIADAKSAPSKEISINKKTIKQGEILFLKLEKDLSIDKITFNNFSYKIKMSDDYNLAMIPISYWFRPGDYNLKIIGNNFNFSTRIKVIDGDFENSYLKVDKEKENIIRPKNKEIEERKKKDSLLIQKARSSSSDTKLWDKNFIWPVDGVISTKFGATRYVNGSLQSKHSGIDIAAQKGTAVKAPAGGKVMLAKNLLVTGNTIIIDHGWELFSSYSHLNKILVNKNTLVKKGDIIAYVGSTGFSTGPHLHWTVKLNNVFVDPKIFINENFVD